ncbi:MAG: hypothetical protein KC502_17395 [Myxococcales bacterium]|nr:hypothetical protein [Myxococcales bacterium]
MKATLGRIVLIFWALSALTATTATAAAPSPTAVTATTTAASDWHVGLNLRTDLGSHPIRLDGGVRLGTWDLVAVADIMAWTDGQMDTDFMAFRRGDSGWATMVGWRWTRISLGDSAQSQQKLLLGVGGDLPDLSASIRASWGMELAAVLVKHGGGLPTESLSFASARHYIDLLNFGMFVRIEFWRGW